MERVAQKDDKYNFLYWCFSNLCHGDLFMIIDAIINFLLIPVFALIEMIPVVDPFKGADISNNLIGTINNVACFLPVNTLYMALGIWLILINTEVLTTIIHFIIRKIPTIE